MTTIQEILQEFDDSFPHTNECKKAEQELQKMKMTYGDKCLCLKREKYKSFLLSSIRKVVEWCPITKFRYPQEEDMVIERWKSNLIKEIDEYVGSTNTTAK